MKIEGGCYCGAVRFEVEGDALFKGQCHCRECQYISGGMPNVVMGMPEAGFRYTKGAPKEFRRSDLEKPVTREFCGECGTPLVSRAPTLPGAVLLKVGSFDDPSVFDGPQMAIFTIDKQSFHQIPDGIASFERTPGG
ncbi:MAG: GFA family protein [Myxococcota bacterium]